MKRLWIGIIMVLFLVTLAGCQTVNDYVDRLRPVVFAPQVTSEEAEFIEMVKTLKGASVAITNTIVDGQTSETRRGSGVVVKQTDGGILSDTYFVITTQWVVEGALSVTVYVNSTTSVSALVLNSTLTYETDEDIAVISFQTTVELHVVELAPLEDINALDTRQIFSIGTPISTGYFNFVTNPAAIMGIQGNMLIHGTNLNLGQIGSPLYLKETGQLVGINTYYSTTAGTRPEVLINQAIFVNRVIELTAGVL